MESLSSLETLVDASPSLMMEPRKSSSSSNAFSTSLFEGNSISESAFAQPIFAVSTAPSAPPASEHSSIPTALFESCLELSCNPSGRRNQAFFSAVSPLNNEPNYVGEAKTHHDNLFGSKCILTKICRNT